MKIGTPVIYFFDNINGTKGGIPNLALIYKRPTSFPVADVLVFDLVDEVPPLFYANTAHGQSLQECLEIGNRWISMEEAEGFGIDLEDGDQDLTEL